MANVKYAILKALLDGAITELLVKTGTDNVYLSDGVTTLSSKLAEIIAALNQKAKQSDLETGLEARPTTEEMNAAIKTEVNALIAGAPEARDTLLELSKAIDENSDLMDALTAAIGNKADVSVVAAIKQTVDSLGALASKSVVSESDLDNALKEKVNAASEGNHSHANKTVLDGITADNVAAWSSKGKFYATASQPDGLTANDLWAQII